MRKFLIILTLFAAILTGYSAPIVPYYKDIKLSGTADFSHLSNPAQVLAQLGGVSASGVIMTGTSFCNGLIFTTVNNELQLSGTISPDIFGGYLRTDGTIPWSQVSGPPDFLLSTGTIAFTQVSGVPAFITSSGTSAYSMFSAQASNAGAAIYASNSGLFGGLPTSSFQLAASPFPWSQITGAPSFITASGSSAYASVSGTSTTLSGTINAGQVTGLAPVATGGALDYSKLTNVPGFITSAGTAANISGNLPWSQVYGYPAYLLSSGTIPWSQVASAPAFVTSSGTVAMITGTLGWNQVSGVPNYFLVTGTLPFSQLSGVPSYMLTGAALPWAQVTGAPSFVLSTGTVANITGTIPATHVSGLSAVATTGNYNDLTHQPSIPFLVSQLTNDSGYITNLSTLPWSQITGPPAFITSSGTSALAIQTNITVTGSASFSFTDANGVHHTLGSVGATGPQGPIGLTGSTGPQGPIGLTGPQGPPGASGTGGGSGLTSATSTIANTALTLAGSTLTLSGTVGGSGTSSSVAWPDITAKPNVITYRGYTTTPINTVALTGSSNAITMTSGTFVCIINTSGTLGQQGPQGATGPAGPTGPTGLTGPIGPVSGTASVLTGTITSSQVSGLAAVATSGIYGDILSKPNVITYGGISTPPGSNVTVTGSSGVITMRSGSTTFSVSVSGTIPIITINGSTYTLTPYP